MDKIVTLTMNPTLDKSTSINHVVPERKLYCETLEYEPGGGGINVARAIKKLGGEAVAFYLSGGAAGQAYRNLLDQEELTHHAIPIEGQTREGLTVSETATEQQFRFNMPGPTVSEAEWQRCLDELTGLDYQPDYLVASGSLPGGVPPDFFVRLAQFAREAGSRFILDSSSQEAMCLALRREGVYLIKPNLREFRELTGSDLESEADQEAKAGEFIEKGYCEVVVVSLGAGGVMLTTANGCERLRTPTVPIKSKVGAGDSTVAGITLALAQGKPLNQAVRFGMAAGAAAVMTPGSQLCRREDTERLYEDISRDQERKD